MTTEDGDVGPADQHSSNPRFCSEGTSWVGEPQITSTAEDNQHLFKQLELVLSLHSVTLWSGRSEQTNIKRWLPGGVAAGRRCVAFNSYNRHRRGSVWNEPNQFDREIKPFQLNRGSSTCYRDSGSPIRRRIMGPGIVKRVFFLATSDVQQHLGMATGVTDETTESPLGCVFCL